MFMAQDDVASYRTFIEEFSNIAAKPYHVAKPEWEVFDTRFKSEPKGIITSMLMPALWHVAGRGALGDARHRTARLALAAARYRAEKGELPKDLESLVPAYIPILPRDPFDGKPMKYHLTDDGAVIYSIGPHGEDENGAPWKNEEKAGDVTLELKR
jgi:hypothetical protein